LENKEQKQKEQIVSQIIDLRRELDLSNDNNFLEFLKKAEEKEMAEILDGLEELSRIFGSYGHKTFAYTPLD